SIIRAAQGAALAAVGLPLLALTSTGVQGLAISFLGVSLGCLLLAALTLRRALGPLSPVLRIDLIHELASAGAPVLAATFVAMVYFRADALLVAAIRGKEDAG